MANLTKEYFDKQLNKLATKQDLKKLATKQDLSRQNQELKAYVNKKNDELARLVAAGFQQERKFWTEKLAEIYPKLNNLEERVIRIERAVGIITN